VALIDRLTSRLVDMDVPLERTALVAAAESLLAEEAPLASPTVAVDAADALVGLGPLEALLRDASVSDVLVNGPKRVWVEREGSLSLTAVTFPDDASVLAAVERVVSPLGLRIDRASPVVDARLPDGSRLHAVMPPVSIDGPVVAIRRFTQAVADLDSLVAAGGIDAAGARLLEAAVLERRNILVSGGTGSGKTTLLNVLSRAVPADERVVTVEDAAELRLAGHVVRLEARPANAEGAGEILVRDLVRHALRLRPDRIVVGEVRGPEALDMIQAMSTGHDGSMSTVHANGPGEALWRLESLALSGERRVSHETVRRQLRSALDLVVQVERRAGRRRVRTIAGVGLDDLEELYTC
jgi:pilus assembly protein CpaF